MLDKESKKELWKLQKDFKSLVNLDNILRHVLADYSIPKLPEKLLFQSHAPSRVDARKTALEDYFFTVLNIPNLPYAAALALCEFISTDMIDPMDIPDTPSKREGYLTKRGKKIRSWKVRYFVIEHEYLNYYDKPGGEIQGSINLSGAKLGRQTKNESENNVSEEPMEKAFRHAFLLVEHKKKDYVRHVLCAESDEDRDLWIQALLEVIGQVTNAPLVPTDVSESQSSKKPTTAPTISDEDCTEDNSTRVALVPPPNQLNAPPKSRSLGDITSPSLDLNPVGSIEDEDGKDRKPKKKGFFSSFRNRNYSHQPTNSSPSVAPEPIDTFQATPYSAVEQQPLYSTPIKPEYAFGDKRLESSSNSNSLQALGKSLEEVISAQDAVQVETYNATSSHITNDRLPLKRVFGVPLPEAISLASKNVHHCVVPAIVYRCIEHLKIRDAVFEEGIFRLSGSTATIRALKERFNNEYDVDLVKSETFYDIHAVAGLLKLYLREIPTLILSSYLAPEFREAVDIEDPTTKVLRLKALVQELPRENRDLLCVLCSLLTEIISYSEINKMNLRNVGIVFAPTLNISAYVLVHFLTDFDAIFGDEEEDEGSTELSKDANSTVESNTVTQEPNASENMI